MDVADIFDMARENAYSSEWNYTDATLLKYVNKRYHQIETAITRSVNEDYFYDIYTTDLVNWQNEYSFESATATSSWMVKILSAGIKLTSETPYYKRITPYPTDTFYEYIDELAATTPATDAFCTLKNGSIFIYPTPSEDVTDWFKVEVVKTLKDLITSSVEADIFPWNSELRNYHYIIALWVAADIFALSWMTQEKIMKEQEFQQELQKMLSEIWDRFDSDVTSVLPDWSVYK